MHTSVMTYVASTIEDLDYRDVLEVGSYNENGTVRDLFAAASTYIGVDMRDGRGVDRVMDAHQLGFPDETFDVVVCTEMLEHDSAPWLSLAEMGRVLEPGGHLIITARGNGFPLHDYPDDYWRFMPSAFPVLIALAGCDVVDITGDHELSGMFGHGVKRD